MMQVPVCMRTRLSSNIPKAFIPIADSHTRDDAGERFVVLSPTQLEVASEFLVGPVLVPIPFRARDSLTLPSASGFPRAGRPYQRECYNSSFQRKRRYPVAPSAQGQSRHYQRRTFPSTPLAPTEFLLTPSPVLPMHPHSHRYLSAILSAGSIACACFMSRISGK